MVWFIIGLVVGLFAGAFGVLAIALHMAEGYGTTSLYNNRKMSAKCN